MQSLYNRIEVMDEYDETEKSMHNFLDNLDLHKINIKMYLEHLRCVESPDVKKCLSMQAIQPNLKERRMLRNTMMNTKNSQNKLIFGERSANAENNRGHTTFE